MYANEVGMANLTPCDVKIIPNGTEKKDSDSDTESEDESREMVESQDGLVPAHFSDEEPLEMTAIRLRMKQVSREAKMINDGTLVPPSKNDQVQPSESPSTSATKAKKPRSSPRVVEPPVTPIPTPEPPPARSATLGATLRSGT